MMGLALSYHTRIPSSIHLTVVVPFKRHHPSTMVNYQDPATIAGEFGACPFLPGFSIFKLPPPSFQQWRSSSSGTS